MIITIDALRIKNLDSRSNVLDSKQLLKITWTSISTFATLLYHTAQNGSFEANLCFGYLNVNIACNFVISCLANFATIYFVATSHGTSIQQRSVKDAKGQSDYRTRQSYLG